MKAGRPRRGGRAASSVRKTVRLTIAEWAELRSAIAALNTRVIVPMSDTEWMRMVLLTAARKGSGDGA